MHFWEAACNAEYLLLSNGETMRVDFDAYAMHCARPRGDEHHLHVSDIFGCTRATYARVYAGDHLPPDAGTARKWYFGHRAEEFAMNALRWRGKPVELQTTVALSLDFGGLIGRMVEPEYEPQPHEFLGHPDGVTEHELIEVKSSWSYTVAKNVDDLPLHYKLQASCYALALDRPVCVIPIVYWRYPEAEIPIFEFDPEQYRDAIIERMAIVLAAMQSHRLPTPNIPDGMNWLCKYCRYAGCQRNLNPNVKVRLDAAS